MFHYASILISLFLLISCGKKEGALRYSDAPEVEIVSDPNLFPSVVMVVLPKGRGICTGTFISPRTVLTAAHCTKEEGRYQIISSFGGASAYQFENLGEGVLDDPFDVSLLILDNDTAKRSKNQVSIIGTEAVPMEKIRIVGYGCNSLDTKSGSGVKRAGTNSVSSVNQYIELHTPFSTLSVHNGRPILGPKDEAGSCFGDSGGPMFRSDEAENAIVGITHAGGKEVSHIVSQYININQPEVQNFLHAMDSQYSLGIFDYCNPADAINGPPCKSQSASMHIVEEIRSIVLKVCAWVKSLLIYF